MEAFTYTAILLGTLVVLFCSVFFRDTPRILE